MRDYVSEALTTETNVVKVVGTKLNLIPDVETIPTSKLRIPDGTINYEGATIFVLELISDGQIEYPSMPDARFLTKQKTSKITFWVLFSMEGGRMRGGGGHRMVRRQNVVC